MESGWANINLNILFHKLILQVEVRSIIINDKQIYLMFASFIPTDSVQTWFSYFTYCN